MFSLQYPSYLDRRQDELLKYFDILLCFELAIYIYMNFIL